MTKKEEIIDNEELSEDERIELDDEKIKPRTIILIIAVIVVVCIAFFTNKQVTKLKEEDVENTVWVSEMDSGSFFGDLTVFMYFKEDGKGEIKSYFDYEVDNDMEIRTNYFTWRIVDNKYIKISCTQCNYDNDEYIIKDDISLVDHEHEYERFKRSSLGSYNKVK